MSIKIIAIVVTYFPERDLLNKNISAFINDVDKVLIWENTPESQKLQYRYINHPKIEYCGDGINSISHALNYAWKYAESNGFDYLLTMDQDSVFENFSNYLNCTVHNEGCPLGIWSPIIVTDKNPKKPCITKQFVEIKYTITSGLLQKVSLISLIGGWNEKFVIDGIDNEYCFHAMRKGVKTYMVKDIFLNHQYGEPQEVCFMGHSVSLFNYSPPRYYSIYRSHVQLLRMFPEQSKFRNVCKEQWGGLIKWIFVFEDQRFYKLFNIVRGILSGCLCKLPTRDS